MSTNYRLHQPSILILTNNDNSLTSLTALSATGSFKLRNIHWNKTNKKKKFKLLKAENEVSVSNVNEVAYEHADQIPTHFTESIIIQRC